jgi:hypothetical protein
MNSMDHFYNRDESPSDAERNRMWSEISAQLPVQRTRGAIIHWKSFLIGYAASFLVLLAGYGAFRIVRDWEKPVASQNERFDRAYSQAMKQLTDAVPTLVAGSTGDERQRLDGRLRGIQDVEQMIEEIRNDMLLYGQNEIKTRQLRRLYAMKMDLVKELVLEGEYPL